MYGSALNFDALTARNGVAAITSYDGGRTWRNTTEVIADTEVAFGNDKNSVTADPARPGRAYQVWDRLQSSPDGSKFITGPTFLSSTRDGGRTWSAPRIIVDTAPLQQTIGNVIVGDPRTGVLYNFYTSLLFTDPSGNDLVFDAHIVTLCREHGVDEILSGDRDFRRFHGVKVTNPFRE